MAPYYRNHTIPKPHSKKKGDYHGNPTNSFDRTQRDHRRRGYRRRYRNVQPSGLQLQKTAIASDAQQYAAEVVQHYKTPVSQGGAMDTSGTLAASMTEAAVAAKIGIGAAAGSAVANENGRYYVSDADTTEVEITGIGKAVRDGKRPKIVTTITFPNGDIRAAATDE